MNATVDPPNSYSSYFRSLLYARSTPLTEAIRKVASVERVVGEKCARDSLSTGVIRGARCVVLPAERVLPLRFVCEDYTPQQSTPKALLPVQHAGYFQES